MIVPRNGNYSTCRLRLWGETGNCRSVFDPSDDCNSPEYQGMSKPVFFWVKNYQRGSPECCFDPRYNFLVDSSWIAGRFVQRIPHCTVIWLMWGMWSQQHLEVSWNRGTPWYTQSSSKSWMTILQNPRWLGEKPYHMSAFQVSKCHVNSSHFAGCSIPELSEV